MVGIVITIISTIFQLVLPSYVKKSINVIEGFIRGTITETLAKEHLLKYIAIILGVALLSGFFTFLMRKIICDVSCYIEYDLKNEIFDRFQLLSLYFYKKNNTGDLMNRMSEDVGKVRLYTGPALMEGINTLTLIICIVPLMFLSAPKLAAYSLIPLPILSLLTYSINKVFHKKSTAIQEFLSTLSNFTHETFSGVGVIKAYGMEPQVLEKVRRLAIEGKNKSMDLVKVNAWFIPLMILLIGVSNISVIYIGGKQYIDGEIESVGVIAEFILYINMLTWPLAVVGWLTFVVQQAEASQKRINELLGEQSEIHDVGHPMTIKGKIEFKSVSFTYPDTGINSLKDISFTIMPGQTVAIFGKTGSGKSTLLDLIARMYDPSSGEILIDDVPIKTIGLRSLRQSIGSIPQDAFLFSDSIRNNIKFGNDIASNEAVMDVAKSADVHENIMAFSNKYDTILGERGVTLSGGQKQRICMARAFLRDPQIYLFDDCLSAVDNETERKILTNLKESSRNKTTLIVSHRISSAKNADKILILDKGALVQEGTHKQLNGVQGFYKDLCINQISDKEN